MNWVKCSERLPNENTEELLIRFVNGDLMVGYFTPIQNIPHFFVCGIQDDGFAYTIDNITHWCEITPPEESE